MRRLILLLLAAIVATPLISSVSSETRPTPFRNQEVVALVGGGNVERMKYEGAFEASLYTALSTQQISIRNLGWEGDTVFEQWREEGSENWRQSRDWPQLLQQVGATVVFLHFGQMESLRGSAAVAEFEEAYQKLLEKFDPSKRRIILLSPLPFQTPARAEIPNLQSRNPHLMLYRDATERIAKAKQLEFIDLTTPFLKKNPGTHEDGIHLNAKGHQRLAETVLKALKLPAPRKVAPELLVRVQEFNRLWFEFWRPMNWTFLEGDRTTVPFSKDWKDQTRPMFSEEMKQFRPILEVAQRDIWRIASGQSGSRIPAPTPAPIPSQFTPAQSAQAELASFQIDPAYEVNLFASEVDGIIKPIQIRWDERGRLWVACTVSYPQLLPGEKPNDKIVICEDTDRDGKADRFTTFVDGLYMPLGFELGDRGIYVCNGTDLMFLADRDGDDRADERRLILSGFGTGDTHQMINSLSWGFSGELWFSQGYHIYSRVETPRGIERLNRSGIWRFNPRTFTLDPYFDRTGAGFNCWGVLQDRWGQVFHKTGADIGGFYSVPGLVRSELAPDSEPLRLFQAPTKSVGFDLIESALYPPELQGSVVIGGYYDNTLQIHTLKYESNRWSSRQLTNLIQTTNSVFRPVDVRVGPDGAIYAADWYNPIIGHYQASIRHPDRDKAQGRIWRVQRKGTPQQVVPNLANASVRELLEMSSSPERWIRTQAKRLLFVKPSREVVAALDAKIGSTSSSEQLVDFLSLYESHETVRGSLLERCLQDPNPQARAYATRLLARWHTKVDQPIALLAHSARDAHPLVRLEAVVAGSYFESPQALGALAEVFDSPLDPYLNYALSKSLHALQKTLKEGMQEDQISFSKPEHLIEVLRRSSLTNAMSLLQSAEAKVGDHPSRRHTIDLAKATLGGPADWTQLLSRRPLAIEVMRTIREQAALRRNAIPIDATPQLLHWLTSGDESQQSEALELAAIWKIQSLSGHARSALQDPATQPVKRQSALRALTSLDPVTAQPILVEEAESGETELARVALRLLAALDGKTAARVAIKRVTQREGRDWLLPVFALSQGSRFLEQEITTRPLETGAARTLLAAVTALGKGDRPLLAALRKGSGYSETITGYDAAKVAELVADARQLGSAERGRELFKTLNCFACHQLGNEGGTSGPNLSFVARGLPIDGLIVELLWPNVNVKEGFTAVRATLKEDRVVEGYPRGQSADHIELLDTSAGKVERIQRSIIQKLDPLGSLMPEGLTEGLSREDLASLIRYLSELK